MARTDVIELKNRGIQENQNGKFFHTLDLAKIHNWINEQRHCGFGR